jgi:aminoglycoside 6'-N-acetyltransferase
MPPPPPTVVIDPDPANARAIAAYRRAGFADRCVTGAEDGESLVLVMEFVPAT